MGAADMDDLLPELETMLLDDIGGMDDIIEQFFPEHETMLVDEIGGMDDIIEQFFPERDAVETWIHDAPDSPEHKEGGMDDIVELENLNCVCGAKLEEYVAYSEYYGNLQDMRCMNCNLRFRTKANLERLAAVTDWRKYAWGAECAYPKKGVSHKEQRALDYDLHKELSSEKIKVFVKNVADHRDFMVSIQGTKTLHDLLVKDIKLAFSGIPEFVKKTVFQTVDQVFAEMNQNDTVAFTGHSLGGFAVLMTHAYINGDETIKGVTPPAEDYSERVTGYYAYNPGAGLMCKKMKPRFQAALSDKKVFVFKMKYDVVSNKLGNLDEYKEYVFSYDSNSLLGKGLKARAIAHKMVNFVDFQWATKYMEREDPGRNPNHIGDFQFREIPYERWCTEHCKDCQELHPDRKKKVKSPPKSKQWAKARMLRMVRILRKRCGKQIMSEDKILRSIRNAATGDD